MTTFQVESYASLTAAIAAATVTTQTRLPTGDSTGLNASQFTASSGGGKWADVDDPVGSPDDDTTYISRQNSNGTQRFTFTPFSLPAGVTISKVTMTWRSKNQTGAVTLTPQLLINSTARNGTGVNNTGSYATYSQDFTTNPATSAPWTQADVEGTGSNPLQEFGLAMSGVGAGEEGRVTQIYLTVEYNASDVRVTCESPTTITANTTIPSTITFEPRRGCLVTAGSAFDLTVEGGLIADAYKWVGTNVTLKFVQADNSVNAALGEVLAEWWGAVGNDSADDTAAFNAALASIKTSRGIALRLLARPYRASVTVPVPVNAVYPICIFGSGDGSAIRSNSASSPALSLDLGVGDPNAVVIFRDFSLYARTSQTAPVLSLKAQGGTTNRLYGRLDNLKVVGGGFLSDCVYVRGGLAIDFDLRTEQGRYALYLQDSSNSVIKIHAGNATCNGVMINSGGNNSIVRGRIEDSTTANTRTISSISGNGTTVTVVTSTAHGMEDMDRVTVSGATGFNFTTPRSVTVVNSTTFTYAGAETGSGSAGTVRISSSVLRLKNTSTNSFYNVANEGKDGIDYCLWIQSTGTSVTGEPSSSHNSFFGGIYGPSSSTARDDLASVLMEGPAHCNEAYGTTIGKASGIKSTHWDVLIEGNASNVRPRLNRFFGHVYIGTGNTGTIRYSEPIVGSYGNLFELSEKVGERTYTAGVNRNISSSTSIDGLMAGHTIYTSGAASAVTVSMFAATAGLKPIQFVNNSAQVLRIDPNGTETIGTGGAGKYLEVAAGGSVLVGCTVAGKLDILASTGTLSYEP